MIFTVTERSLYKRCRRRWYYSSANGMSLQPIIDAPALTLGLVVHKALEQWFEHPEIELAELFKANAYFSLQKIIEHYETATKTKPSALEMADVKQAIVLGISMMQNYQEQYVTPVPEGFKLISAEQRLILDVPDCEHKLEARIDAVIQCLSDGDYFNVDHKTYEKKMRRTDIANSDQFLAYQWAAQRALGIPISGYMYNGLWKRDRVPKNSSNDLFHREIFERPQYELEAFTFQLASELDEMAEVLLKVQADNPFIIFPNRRWEGCWDCKGFEKLCEAQSKSPKAFELLKANMYRIRDRDEEIEDLFSLIEEAS